MKTRKGIQGDEMKDGKVVLGVDFDGTIVQNKFPEVGELKPKAKEVLQALDKAGCKIIIHTCRTNPMLNDNPAEQLRYITEMEQFLQKNEIPYDEVWNGIGKPFVHLFIDDCALPFTTWTGVLDQILFMMRLTKEKQ